MLTSNILKKFIYSSASKLIASFGIIFFNFIIIDFTNQETLGMLMVTISLITFLSVFSKLGLNHLVLRLMSIFYENNDKKKIKELIIYSFIISGLISSLIAFLIIFFENQIALQIYNNKELIGILKIIAISLPIFTFIQIQKSLLRSFNLPEISNFSDIGSILFVCCIITLFLNAIEIYLTSFRISLFFLFSCFFIFASNSIIIFYTLFLKIKKFKEHKFIDIKKKLIKTLPDYFAIDFVNYSLVWSSIFICTFFYKPVIIGNFSTTYWLAFSLLFFPLILNSIYAPSYAIFSEKK